MENTFLRKTSRNIGVFQHVVGGYTVPSATATTIIGLTCANVLTTAITVDVSLYNTTDGSTHIVKGATVPAGGSLVVVGGDQKVVMETGDQILVTSSASNSCEVIMSILEIT